MSDYINTIDVLGDETVSKIILDRSIAEFRDDKLTSLGEHAFAGCSKLINVDLPNVVTTGSNPFLNCVSLKKIYLPKVTHAVDTGGCSNIEIIYLPSYNGCGYAYNASLSKLKVYAVGNGVIAGGYGFSGHALRYDPSLKVIVVATSTVTGMNSALLGTPYAEGGSGGYVVVPSNLIENYKTATNWSKFYAYGTMTFLPLEDYTVDGTMTGELVFCTDIDLDTEELTFTEPGTKTLAPTIIPDNAIETLTYECLEWSSDNPFVATVSDGVVTAKFNGTAIITVACGNASASCDVTVNAFDVSINVLDDIEWVSGYINTNGTTAASTVDAYTNAFNVSDYAGTSINVDLGDSITSPNNCRIVYYNEAGKVAGYTQGVSGNTVITSTVPATAHTARVSVNMTGGFAGIIVTTSENVIVGYLPYTA